MPHDPQQLLVVAEELHKPMEVYLKWKIVCDRYERGKSSKLAQVLNQLLQQTPDLSYAKAESQALASEDFRKYLEEFHEAEKKMVEAKILFETVKTKFDALQSVLAYERDSMRRLG